MVFTEHAYHDAYHSSRGVRAQNFSLGTKTVGKKIEAEGRQWVELFGSKPPPHQLGGLRERCELPQRGSALSMASPDTIILLIVDYHAAIGGGAKPPCPSCVRPCIHR